MTEIYLIRHTQAEGNIFRMMQGHWDANVTAVGREQVIALAERFRSVRIDALYTSDLFRTRFTASAITKYHDVEMIPDPALREIHMGVWESRFFGDLAYCDSARVRTFMTDPDRFEVEGGETCRMVADRAVACLERIAAANDGKVVAAVSHGMTIRCILARLRGISTSEVPIVRNTSVTHLFFRNGVWTVDYFDDISHLADLRLPVWPTVANLRAVYFRPGTDDPIYSDCYADAWAIAHGSLKGFMPSVYELAAHTHVKNDPKSVMCIYENDTPAGLVDLDTVRGQEDGYGWVSFLYLRPQYRHSGNGIQLLGRAVAHYRSLGRKTLRLTVAEDNVSAVSFYRKYGFRVIGEEQGVAGKLLLMEADLEKDRSLL